jgi:hypothetical protein
VIPEGSQGSLIGSVLGGYQLVALLGSGGMAEVYRGLEPRLAREVAVKVLPGHLAQDAGYVARFRDEARRVAALNHPNIVPLYRFGEERGLLYIVMPILEESLRDRIDRERIIGPAEAVRLAVQVAAALDAAHDQGLVHRDVKPENVLINAQGRAMLTDFGIARELEVLRKSSAVRTLASTGLPVGTPEYMAPEQLRGGSIDQRADIYALGAVLYEMLTGVVPHDANTPYEVAALVLTQPTLPPSQHNPAIWPELEAVVLRALAPEAADRYPDMRTFATALHLAVSGHEPTAALTKGDTPPVWLGHYAPSRQGAGAFGLGAAAANIRERLGRRWVNALPLRAGQRNLWLVAAAAALVIVGLCAGSSLAFVRLFSSLSAGTTQPTATSRSGVIVVGTSTRATAGTSNTPAAASATRTAAVSATRTVVSATASPTATASATATATTTPRPIPNIAVSPPTLIGTSSNNRICTGIETLTNTGTSAAQWSLTNLPPNQGDDQTWSYTVDGTPAGSSPQGTLQPSAQSNLTITVSNGCSSGQHNQWVFTVTVTGGSAVSFTFKY